LLIFTPHVNKTDKALDNLEFIMVQELFMTDIAKRADIIIGVSSVYEKEGVYVSAMRRLHLSQPLVESDLPDDWEVIQLLAKKLGANYSYNSSEELWDEVTQVANKRFSGAKYYRLKRHAKRGIQWPVFIEDTPVLHILDFRTEDGLGRYVYKQYQLRGMVKEILEGKFYSKDRNKFYLTTGRTLSHYNNSAQTKRSKRLLSRYDEDVILASVEDREILSDRVILKSKYGKTAKLPVKFTDKIRPKTLFVTFHHAKSRVNSLFGDEADEFVLTARFKSVKVEVILG